MKSLRKVKLCAQQKHRRGFHGNGRLHAGLDGTRQSAESTERKQAADARHVNSPERWSSIGGGVPRKTERRLRGPSQKNPAALINLTPLKALTYESDGRLTHFLARGVK